MAGVTDQDSSLGPLSTGNMQSWGEADTKSVHFLDVVAASWHYESRQFIPVPNCHMLINPGHSDLISCHRQVLGLAPSVTQPAATKESLLQLARVQNSA